LYISTQAEISV